MRKIYILLVVITLASINLKAQEDLLDILNSEQTEEVNTTMAIFKGARLISGHTIVTRKMGELEFVISHRFGRINSGIDEFFGLDGANVRFSLEYGITDNLTAGIGRNSFEKVYDGFLKYSLLKQSTGEKNMPVSLTAFSSMAIRTLKDPDFTEDDFNSKVSYTHQVLIARKFNDKFSFQLAPTYVHRNKVLENQENDILALGIGGRMKLNTRVSLNAEYYYRLTEELDASYKDSLGVGIEIETGGHVFHLNFTNSRSMVERGFITETDGNFFKGDIHFGFNISRVF
ncbi:DUF5777 family beta-barrel protein [Roseivirga echinicomitans]|uniref:DUF5777 domain-containing protein n=1 Tax=Roseivirga echinicomitans TaxID=296218 RepID=A0A150XK56_9BACT|nr:DUF5777 family beta-barrel protein [Roseivirga echinicomitans]KYG79128.1 hypothetical protein AWN68_17825 [Roseivirga echinicomitans]